MSPTMQPDSDRVIPPHLPRTADFDRPIPRRHTASEKWDRGEQVHGVENLLPMWVADMDFQAPPQVIQALMRRVEHGIFGYTLIEDSYYRALMNWFQKRQHWTIQKDWIVTVPGVMPAVNLALQTFSQPGDKVVIQPPVYHPFKRCILSNGRQVVENPLQRVNGAYRMDYKQLAGVLDPDTRLIILCSPHNPVGRVWRPEELEELAEICLKHGLIIVSDEIHSDLIMPGHTHTPTTALSPEVAERTITFTAPSKTFNVAGLNLANAIIPNRRLLDEFQKGLNNLSLGGGNLFGILAAETAYTHGEAWLEELLRYLQGNYDFLVAYLAERLPRVKVLPLEGTYLAWLDFASLGLPDQAIKNRLLKQARLWLDGGPKFGSGGQGFQRLNIACPRATLEEGLRRLVSAFS